MPLTTSVVCNLALFQALTRRNLQQTWWEWRRTALCSSNCFGQYAATGDRPHDPRLSWHVSVALTAAVREHNELGRQVQGGIIPLLARIHQGYRAHPDVQAWAAAQELEEALRMAICLGSVD